MRIYKSFSDFASNKRKTPFVSPKETTTAAATTKNPSECVPAVGQKANVFEGK